jgi:hypothetical protein
MVEKGSRGLLDFLGKEDIIEMTLMNKRVCNVF